MIYRMRTYRAEPDRLASSHRVFFEQVLPVHRRHGARFVGRWQTDEGEVVVIWEYDSRAECERIQKAVREDPQSLATREVRESQGLLGAESREVLMTTTGPDSDAGATS